VLRHVEGTISAGHLPRTVKLPRLRAQASARAHTPLRDFGIGRARQPTRSNAMNHYQGWPRAVKWLLKPLGGGFPARNIDWDGATCTSESGAIRLPRAWFFSTVTER
jgi:hypothetical protein